MLFDRFRVSSTRSVEEMISGISTRSPQFRRLGARLSPDWQYVFNRAVVGTVTIGISEATHVRYEATGNSDIVITGCFSGNERMSRGSETRAVSELPSFSPSFAVSGEVRNASFYTVRLSPARLAVAIDELDGKLDLQTFVEKNWLTPLPGSPSLARFLRYLFDHIDEFGLPGRTEARALEDLIYAHAARVMLVENRAPSLAGNAKAFARCAAYIEEHLAEDISIRDVAKVAGLSLRSVQQMFRQVENATITGFITERRLLRARELLRSPELEAAGGVAAACSAVGFRHLSYFGRLYRNRFGEVPSATLRRGR